MKKKLYDVLNLLKEKNQEMTGDSISLFLNVSSRTICNYVKQINCEFPNLIISSQKDYSLNFDKYNEYNFCKKQKLNSIPQTAKERINYIINSLIKKNVVNIFDLADELFVSDATIKKDLQRIKAKVSNYDLSLQISNFEITLMGTEINKRKLLSNLIYKESNGNFTDYSVIQNCFHDVNVNFIKEVTATILNKNHFIVNDFSLLNLVLHITITIHRLKCNCELNCNGASVSKRQINNSFDAKTVSLVDDLSNKLEAEFAIVFSKEEKNELCLLLLSRTQKDDIDSINLGNLAKYIGDDTYHLVNEILKQLYDDYLIDLSIEDFTIRFALHISNLLLRAEFTYLYKNPLTTNIRQTCPLIYDAAVSVANTIYKEKGIVISDDEIAYIAIHIGAAIETQKKISQRIPTTLFIPDYNDMASNIYNAISKEFGNIILINEVKTQLNSINPHNEIIISTVNLKFENNIPVCIISPFFNNVDKININSMIKNILIKKRQEKFKSNLNKLLDDDYFEITNQKYTKNSSIHYMARKFINNNIVNRDYEKKILEREKLSSTSFSNFAIPHTVKMDANFTKINVLILKKPLFWDDNQVSLVVMLAFNKNDRKVFNEVFTNFTEILLNPSAFVEIIKCKTKKQFIETMVNSIELPQ